VLGEVRRLAVALVRSPSPKTICQCAAAGRGRFVSIWNETFSGAFDAGVGVNLISWLRSRR
jgi:hypothetical protein